MITNIIVHPRHLYKKPKGQINETILRNVVDICDFRSKEEKHKVFTHESTHTHTHMEVNTTVSNNDAINHGLSFHE